MATSKLQAWRARRHGLDGSLTGGTAADVLEQTGWTWSVGGAGPYLTLGARAALSREGVDAAVARVEIQELPAARGCTYVVPGADFALALPAGQRAGGDADLRTADRGRLVGLWEFDVESDSIAWISLVPTSKDLVQAVAATEAFVKEDLGDARSFSLDSPKSRAPRIAALREASGA